MKNSMFSAAIGVLIALCLANPTRIQAQQRAPVTKPFELSLGVGAFIKTMEGSAGVGAVALLEPRYFIRQNMAVTARYQSGAYSTTQIEPGVNIDDREVIVSSLLGGVLFRNRQSHHNWFWGVQTGIAITEEFIGEDPDGYAMYGNAQTFWVLQPRVGYALHRFEMEMGYHFSPAREARFGQITLGWRFWGNKKQRP